MCHFLDLFPYSGVPFGDTVVRFATPDVFITLPFVPLSEKIFVDVHRRRQEKKWRRWTEVERN